MHLLLSACPDNPACRQAGIGMSKAGLLEKNFHCSYTAFDSPLRSRYGRLRHSFSDGARSKASSPK